MNIVCATDDNFVQHCCVMLVSLLLHNKNVHAFILTEGLIPENVRIISEEVEAKGGKVTFCKVDSSIAERFPMPSIKGLNHISRATYYRLLIPELLPRDIDKAIYLDCDIVINSSLNDLWNTDLTGYALAASPQIGSGHEARRLGYPMKYGYFNAGMNVINLVYWRENNVVQSLMDYIEDNFDKIKFHDQDTLNAVLHDKTLHVESKWNMTAITDAFGLMSRGDKENGVVINDYAAEKLSYRQNWKNPPVLHFASRPKPWQEDCFHPLAYMYFDYALQTLHFKGVTHPNHMRHKLSVFIHNVRGLFSAIYQKFVHTDPTRL